MAGSFSTNLSVEKMAESDNPESGDRSVGARITDEAVAALLKRKGVARPAHRPWNTAASADAIRHFAVGIGNLNPLWVDAAYAGESRFGSLIAPPTFEYSCGVTFGGGIPGVHSLYGGSDFTFLHPIREGDSISATIQLDELVEKSSKYAGRMFQQIERMVYTNQEGVVVTDAQHWVMRTERDTARARAAVEKRYPSRALQTYTEEAIAGIDVEYGREEVRGQKPRFWEDVDVGDLLPPVVKGPLRVSDVLAYLMGTGSPYVRAHAGNYRFRLDHPAAYVPNDQGIPDIAERVHWENDFARAIGVAGSYDYGQERPCWIAHMLTNWMGDSGWLRRLKVRLARFNLVGDTTHTGARVEEKFVDGDDAVVRCSVWAVNQIGEITAKGEAWVVLPCTQTTSDDSRAFAKDA
jgi:acyl dehydratase